jgi:hypothetical protein
MMCIRFPSLDPAPTDTEGIVIVHTFSNPFLYAYVKVVILLTRGKRGHRGRARMVVGLTTNYAISSYHH